MIRQACILLSLLPLLSPEPLAQGTVRVVDAANQPGAEFTTISAAILGSADGDVLLIRPGEYAEEVVLDNRSLHLQADPGSTSGVVSVAGIRVQNLGPARNASIRDLTISVANGPSLTLQDNQGSVVCEGIEVQLSFTLPRVSIEDCASVVMTGMDVTDILSFSTSPRAVLESKRSSLYLFDSTIGDGGVGGAGILVEEGLLTLSESTILGAVGAAVSVGHGGCAGGDGWPAIVGTNGALIYAQDSIVLGGPPDASCPGSVTGVPYSLSAAQLISVASQARTHRASSPVRDDESISISLEGQPGDLVWVYLSTRPGLGLIRPTFDGAFLLQAPLRRVVAGTLPASGIRSMTVPVPDLGPGIESAVLFTQAVFFDGLLTRYVLSEPSVVTLLDAAF